MDIRRDQTKSGGILLFGFEQQRGLAADGDSVGRCGLMFDLSVRHIKPLAIMPSGRVTTNSARFEAQ
ncbi:MAG: hypothetical protein KME20_26995 [Kaiparowitsia implicata GSE-PSE-MK54-09C]|jgi:hypothetical protein|nr:hypothetical protein [Kaiparowitsia implicata GSE-PSE-MK54-09C]